jgi:zinc/manganese transport system substrate-binding protein
MRSPLSRAALAGAALALLLGATACGNTADAASSDGSLRVVASTNVWGDVVSAVGGDLVTVDSLIDDPSADPHSFEANPRTQLAISRADVLVENGGGYDDFMTTLRENSHTSAAVVDAVDVSGRKAAAGGELNEHVWYDFPTIEKVANRVAAVLSTKDGADKATFTQNAAVFVGKVRSLQAAQKAIKAAHAGQGVAITEPVPLYLLEAGGLVNRTPEEFSEAIEDGTDVAPTVLRQTLALFSRKQVKVLAYNEQTSGPETEKVLSAAKSAGIPVVPVTETLPAGKNYVSWMSGTLSALKTALG